MELRVACPPDCLPDPVILAAAGARRADLRGPARGGGGAPPPSTPTCGSRWARRTRASVTASTLRDYRVTSELMRLARHDAVFLHCLPAHRGEEVDAAVIDGPASLVWRQAANRLPTEQALLYALVTGNWEV